MDPKLSREREVFKKKALTIHSVQKKKESKSDAALGDEPNTKTPTICAPKVPDVNPFNSASGSSQYRFGILAKIVEHMKTRHQEGDTHPLTLVEILEETNQLDIGIQVQKWLATEALINNPKIEVTRERKFLFKPMYKIRDRRSLLRLLKLNDIKGRGGILLEDIQESLPHAEKALTFLRDQNEIIYVQRPLDKKKIVFYNDRSTSLPIDEEFKKMWRSVPVDGLDDAKIEKYLEKQGIPSMQDRGSKKPIPPVKRKKRVPKDTLTKPKDNKHVADVLENY